jgi:hypothetical protein
MASCDLNSVLNFNQNFACGKEKDQKIDLSKYDEQGIRHINALYLPTLSKQEVVRDVEKCVKTDPRLFRFSDYTLLDRELDETIPKLSEVSIDKDMDNYGNIGKHYKNYEDIKAGQIKYYLDKDIEHFYKPQVVNGATIKCKVYIDPMGSNRFEFKRELDKPYCPYRRNETTEYENCLSFVEDTNFRSTGIIFSRDTNLPKNARIRH